VIFIRRVSNHLPKALEQQPKNDVVKNDVALAIFWSPLHQIHVGGWILR
jgi:hypothetical protein